MSDEKKSKGPKKSLKDRIIEASTISQTALLHESKVFGKKEMLVTTVPMINVALSGMVDGGLVPGLFIIAGPSKHFKSAFSLLMAQAFMKKNPDGIILFYDSEFGTPESYFASFGIPPESVVHSPITNIEELKFDLVQQLEHIENGDKVMILVDSIGNLASKKEVEDAIEGKSAADMTRAKAFKSMFRIVTPHLNLKNIPMIAVGHVYSTLEMYAKTIVSGGTGQYLSADTIWVLSRRQNSEGQGADRELLGYDFDIKIEKSRHCREGVKIPITVSFEDGIKQWSGLLEEAMELGFIVKPSKGWYAKCNPETGEVEEKNYREKDIVDNGPFWIDMFKTTKLTSRIRQKYTLSNSVTAGIDATVSLSAPVEEDDDEI